MLRVSSRGRRTLSRAVGRFVLRKLLPNRAFRNFEPLHYNGKKTGRYGTENGI